MHRREQATAAWERIMALGGVGVWENDFLVVSLAECSITDADLAVFRDFPLVQILDLSRTAIRGDGLVFLGGATALEQMIVVGTNIDEEALAAFRHRHPTVIVVTSEPSKGTINPFTSAPL